MKLHSNIEGKGKPLFILHGFLGMGDNWKTLAKSYAESGFEVHLIDQRNHGRSPHSQVFNYTAMADDVKAYADQHQIKNCAIIGHSMGGKTAMLLACRLPALVNKLCVADIAPKYYPQHHQEILAGLDFLNENNISSRKQADEMLSEFISNQGIRLFLLKNLYRNGKDNYGLRLNLPVLKENIEEIGKPLPENAQFNGKTLFLRGGNSDYILDEDQDLIKKHFPNSSIKTIKNAGHWLHAEQKDAFFDESMRFLQE